MLHYRAEVPTTPSIQFPPRHLLHIYLYEPHDFRGCLKYLLQVTTRQITEVGFVLGILGALLMAWAAGVIAIANRSYSGATDAQHRREKWSNLFGALLIAAGFGAELLAVLRR